MKLVTMSLDIKTKHIIKGALPEIKENKVNLQGKEFLQKNPA